MFLSLKYCKFLRKGSRENPSLFKEGFSLAHLTKKRYNIFMEYTDVINELERLADEKYKVFNDRLLRTDKKTYGVRTPDLRALGKRIKREYPTFAEDAFARGELSHEEILLVGMQLGKDVEANIGLLNRLFAISDSWAQIDQIVSKFGWIKDKRELMRRFEYLKTGGEFEKRAYFVMLMTNCVSEEYLPLVEDGLRTVPFGEYYTDMAAAWLICDVCVKSYNDGLRLLALPELTPFVRMKAASKCRDSFRLTKEQKDEITRLSKEFIY